LAFRLFLVFEGAGAAFADKSLAANSSKTRGAFRTFRLDRMSHRIVLEERYRAEAGKTAFDFLKQDAEMQRRTKAQPDFGS
jgi:predicted DNA-binding transcriptional regulator YafY